jgi:hypothetical protein
VDHVAILKIDGDAVANDAGATGKFYDVTDHLGCSCGTASPGLGVDNMPS